MKSLSLPLSDWVKASFEFKTRPCLSVDKVLGLVVREVVTSEVKAVLLLWRVAANGSEIQPWASYGRHGID